MIAGKMVGHSPGNLSSRLLNSATAFVAVILTSTYTANLAAFITARRTQEAMSISSLASAAMQNLPIFVASATAQLLSCLLPS